VAADSPRIRRMNRFELTQRVLRVAGNEIIVAGIGNAGFDLFAARDRPENFYMLGSMGLGVPIGHGLALAQPERAVIVMEGEGSILMNLGALATVGREAPENLTIIVWDNAQWQLTGGQSIATAETCDIAAVAAACGIRNVVTPEDAEAFESDVRRAIDSPGPHLFVAHIDSERARASYHGDPIHIKRRFMQAIGIEPD
jgi:thiamine pyrophosphate-dependent acetolactate synthase large subunit-like protein